MFAGLKSYHLLTLFFWFLEGKDQKIWNTQKFVKNIRELLHFVSQKLREESIPHYFIRFDIIFTIVSLVHLGMLVCSLGCFAG